MASIKQLLLVLAMTVLRMGNIVGQKWGTYRKQTKCAF